MGIDRPDGPYAEEMTAPPAWPEVDEDTLRDAAEAFHADHNAVDEQLWAFQHHRAMMYEGAAAVWSGDAADAAHAKHQKQIATLQSQRRARLLRRSCTTIPPLADRDHYNREHLDELQKANQAELDRLHAHNIQTGPTATSPS